LIELIEIADISIRNVGIFIHGFLMRFQMY
jgi:hypothetical protein